MSKAPTLTEPVANGSNGAAGPALRPGREIMPMPLTPFERYMLVDDREDYPMTFAHILEFEGEMDREAMESAVRSALERHPLTCAQVEKAGSKCVWVAGTLPETAMQWHETPPVRLPFAGRRVDLFKRSGFQVDGYTADGKSMLLFSTHHAVTDGLGMLQIVGDVLAFYAQKTAEPETKLKTPKFDQERLRTRGEYVFQLPHPISRWTFTKGLMAETWRLVTRRPEPIVTPRSDQDGAASNTGYVCVTVDEDAISKTRKQATADGAGLNQVLIRDLFLTMKQWQETKTARRGKWLRVTIPTSLRSREDRNTPAANILGYLMLTRNTEDWEREQELLDGIVAEVDFAEKWAMGTMFSTSVEMVDRVPGLLHLLAQRSRRFSSVVLSNLGDVTRRLRAKFPRRDGRIVAGNLELVNVTAAPPVRPGTSIAIAITSCAGKFNVCAQYDAASISADEVREFLTHYVGLTTRAATVCDEIGAS